MALVAGIANTSRHAAHWSLRSSAPLVPLMVRTAYRNCHALCAFLVSLRTRVPIWACRFAAYDRRMQPGIDVTLGAAGPPHEVVLKLQGHNDWELNVWAAFEDLAKLRDVRAAKWDQRKSIAAGVSVGGRVFWCAPGEGTDPEIATVLIGHDDEAWDIAFLGRVS